MKKLVKFRGKEAVKEHFPCVIIRRLDVLIAAAWVPSLLWKVLNDVSVQHVDELPFVREAAGITLTLVTPHCLKTTC